MFIIGIERHIEEKGYGDWFKRLQAALCERDSNKQSTCVEPGILGCEAEGKDSTPSPPKQPTPSLPKRKGKGNEVFAFLN